MSNQKILIQMPDIYAEAYKLMAKDLRASRQDLIGNMLIAEMNRNPEYLDTARLIMHARKNIVKHEELPPAETHLGESRFGGIVVLEKSNEPELPEL